MLSGQSDNATASTQDASQATDQSTNDQSGATDATQQQQQDADTTNAAEKPAEGAKAEGDKADGDDKKPEGAPDEYEDFSAPDGVAIDADALTEFKGLAKELNLSQTDAQKVVDLGPKLMEKWQSKNAEAISTAVAQWEKDTIADQEIGGDKLKENLAVAKTALKTFGSEQLAKLLHESGLGNHPEIIRAFYRVGKATSEDGFVGGKRESAKTNDAKSFYPNSNMK